MQNRKQKILTATVATALAASLLIGGGTFAYLQDNTDDVVNNFNTNQVTVDLEETTGNDYEIIPGTSQGKDPTVTVNATLPAYVYVEVNDATDGLVTYEIADGWTLLDGYDNVYYREVEPAETEQTFPVLKDDTVSYDAALENADMVDETGALKEGLTLTFQASAIQKEPFADAVAAYTRSSATIIPEATMSSLRSTVASSATQTALLTDDISTASAATLVYNGERELVLDGTVTYTAENTNPYAAIWVYGSIGKVPTLTLDGAGGITAENDYCVYVGRSQYQKANVVINDGTYKAPVSAVTVYYGTLTVNGGFFEATADDETQWGAEYLLNCIDAQYKNGQASIVVTGGTFVNFDPSNNRSEGEGTNYVAEGYVVEQAVQENGDIWYTVVPAQA